MSRGITYLSDNDAATSIHATATRVSLENTDKADLRPTTVNFSSAMTKYWHFAYSKKRSSIEESATLSTLTELEHMVQQKACLMANPTQTWTKMYPWMIWTPRTLARRP